MQFAHNQASLPPSESNAHTKPVSGPMPTLPQGNPARGPKIVLNTLNPLEFPQSS